MEQRLRAITNREVVREFKCNGKDLIADVDGKNSVKWALRCTRHMFTDDELINNCLTPNRRTTRGHLDEGKVRLLRNALQHKYQFAAEKQDKAWAAIRDAVNTQGRNLGWQRALRNLVRN